MTAPDPAAGFLAELAALLARAPATAPAAPPEAPDAPEVLTVAEVARFLRVNRKTVYDAIDRGDLPARRMGRGRRRLVIGRAALLAWLGGRA